MLVGRRLRHPFLARTPCGDAVGDSGSAACVCCGTANLTRLRAASRWGNKVANGRFHVSHRQGPMALVIVISLGEQLHGSPERPGDRDVILIAHPIAVAATPLLHRTGISAKSPRLRIR